MTKYSVLLIGFFMEITVLGQSKAVVNYYNDIEKYGQEPTEYVAHLLNQYDLIVFDDGLHSAFEPFVFFDQLINSRDLSGKINYIFLETISTTAQPLIDRFLNAGTRDTSILIKVFQDDYTGTGWRFQTYLDLFKTVWEHNQGLPDTLKIKIIGVNPPIYWEAIHTWKDYEIFQSSLKSRDYFLYLEILQGMKGFSSGEKGLFVTNTRHAYKNIKDSAGRLYWNTTTFFNQRNPGKVFSIRMHNVMLSIESVKKTTTGRKSTDGLSELVYRWIRMDNGRWDSAFAMNGNKPVAIPFKNTAFGQTPYPVNQMTDIATGTCMADAYDALIFLTPLTDLHFSAEFNYIYTPAFKPELERRLRLLQADFDAFLKKNGDSSFDEYYEQISQYIPVSKNTLIGE